MGRLSFLTMLALIACAGFSAAPAAAQDRAVCEGNADPQGVIVALDGTVEIRETSGRTLAASVGAILCARDQITTGARSRIEFRLTGKNTTTGSSSNSVTVIPASRSECVELRSGLMSFLSSVIGSHCISTPFIDAGIDGTEALVAVDGQTGDSFVLVQEGVVSVRDRRATSAQSARLQLIAASADAQNAAFATQAQTLTRATPDNVPSKFRELLLRPADATDWAIHYPPILLAAGVTDPSVREAAALLDAGEITAANALLNGASLVGRDKAAALSLQSIAAIYKNLTIRGQALADEAVATDPGLGAAHIAQTYAYQATGQVERARTSAEAAVSVDPNDAYAWARLAELHLTVGARRDARDAIEQSLALTETTLGRTIEGFAALSTNEFAAANASFRRAINLDSEAPLPRLGLGLKEIRLGNIAQGRLEIETAVALDPKRASLRTWLGRAYSAEGRGEKARAQYDMARANDPDDPLPYFFDAMELYTANRPVLALRAIDAARLRDTSRSVVRSAQGLGEDRAVTGSATGRIYDTLGLEMLATSEGSRAVRADQANPDAHLFLADTLGRSNASETARTSENLQATLLAPPSKAPGDILRSEANLALLEGTGATQLTLSEFSPAFNSNGPALYATGVLGTQGTFGEELSGAFLHDNFSVNASQLYYTTDGYRENNQLEHRVYQVQTKFQPVPEWTLFGELRRRETESGDRFLRFDIDLFSDPFISKFERDTARFGTRFEIDEQQDVLALFTHAALDTETRLENFSISKTDKIKERSNELQLQHIGNFGQLDTVIGGGYAQTSSDIENIEVGVPTIFTDNEIQQGSVYGYGSFSLPQNVKWTAGVSLDYYDDQNVEERDRLLVNPKLGAEIDLYDTVTLRAAYIRSLSKRLLLEQTLEPTTIAGFVQFDDTLNSVVMDRIGVGADVRLGERLKAGVEGTFTQFDYAVEGSNDFDTREQKLRGYVGAALTDDLYLTLDGSFERTRSNFFSDFPEYEAAIGSAGLRYFHPSGFFASAEVDAVHTEFQTRQGVRIVRLVEDSDSFALVNASIGFRLPDERGVISLEAQNLFDTSFGFRERSLRRDLTVSPRFARERTILGKITLKF